MTPRRNHFKSRGSLWPATRQQRGATLLEIVAALGVMALLTSSLIVWIQQMLRTTEAQSTGLEMSAWKLYAEKHVLPSVVSNPASLGLSEQEPLRAFSLPLNNFNPNTLMQGQEQQRFLHLMRHRDAQGAAVLRQGQRVCLLLKRIPPADNAATPSISAALITAGSPAGASLGLGYGADAASVLGPAGGRVSDGADCRGEQQCLTNGIGPGHTGWVQPLSTAQSQALAQGCGAATGKGHLVAMLTSAQNSGTASGEPLYRVPLSVTLADGRAAPDMGNSLNTMQHDLIVKGDIAAGLPMRVAGTSCVSSDGLGRASGTGQVLQCVAGVWQRPQANPPIASIDGALLAGGKAVAEKIGLDGAGWIPQISSSATAALCDRLGDFRRNEEGGTMGCQKLDGATSTRWERMGAAALRWTMLPNPIEVTGIPQTVESWNVGAPPPLDFKSQMQAAGIVVNYSALRMALVNVVATPRYTFTARNMTAQMYMCLERYRPDGSQNPWGNFYYSRNAITDSDFIVDVNRACPVDFGEIFRDYSNAPPVETAELTDAIRTPDGPEVVMRILGYLCEGPRGCALATP
jgi:hypothetical protein